jgi:putative transposase
MPRRAIPLITGCCYHLYNRGHNRASIFFEPDNFTFFLHRLRRYVAREHASVIAYVLMPNHYHLLVQAQTDRLSHAMQLLGISYTKAINTRFHRSGALFQGAFQSKLVNHDAYLLHLSRYIHLNPVRARLVWHPEDWQYSSYLDYVGLREGTLPQHEAVLSQFNNQNDYRAFVETYTAQDREYIQPFLFS